MKKKITLKDILTVMAKLASGHPTLSLNFFLFYGAELVILAIYALLWQQMIKKFELSIAYTNRAMALLWSLIWAAVIFHDKITLKNIIGVALVITGTIIVNGGQQKEELCDEA